MIRRLGTKCWRTGAVVLCAGVMQGSAPSRCDTPEACHTLAEQRAEATPPDQEGAAKLYAFACKGGHGPACSELASMTWHGIGVPEDRRRAVSLYEQGCALRYGEACGEAARHRRWGELHDEDRGLADATAGCALDDGEACYELGLLRADGGSALEAYRRACDLGWSDGCVSLAWTFAWGRGVPQDLPHARSVLHGACEAGRSGACAEEARYLSEGFGGVRDPEAAVVLFERGCAAGSRRGCAGLAWALLRGRGVAPDPERARELLARACDRDYAEACTDLADVLEHGIGGPRDLDGAHAVLDAACDRGLGDACLALGRRQVDAGHVAAAVGTFQRACGAGANCWIGPGSLGPEELLRGACRVGHGPSCLAWSVQGASPMTAAQAWAAGQSWAASVPAPAPVTDRPPADEALRACFSELTDTLASSALAGRGPGGGAEAAAGVLASRFEAVGLQPLAGAWRIPFDTTWDREWRGGVVTLDGRPLDGWMPFWTSASGAFEGPLVKPSYEALLAGKGLRGQVAVVANSWSARAAESGGAVAAVVVSDDLEWWVDGRAGAFQDGPYGPSPPIGIPVLGLPSSVSLPRSGQIAGTVEITPVAAILENVVGVLPGRGALADEIVVVGAHYDHLGVDRLQRVRLGADDNASGVAAMVCALDGLRSELAGARSVRTVVAVGFGGEELGLLGSQAFVEDEVVPTEAIAAMVNIDMVGRLGDQVLRFRGARSGSFAAPIETAARIADLAVDPESPAEHGSSDHVPFLVAGVPSLMLFTGVHHEYHQPLDEPALLDLDGGARITRFLSALVARLATGERPVFAGGCGGETEPPLGLQLRWEQALVACVEPNSPAAAYGLQAGDRIVAIGGRPVADRIGVMVAIEALWPVEEMPITVERGGGTQVLSIGP